MVRSPAVRLLRGRSRGVVVLWIAVALMASSCTGDSTEPGNGQTETTAEPGNTSSTAEPSSTADFIDPRRRQPDLDDPAELKSALLAMSITPQEANASLDYLAPEAPVAWAPGDRE